MIPANGYNDHPFHCHTCCKDNKSFAYLLGIIASRFIVAPIVLVSLWGWFDLMQYGLPKMTFWPAVGIIFLLVKIRGGIYD